MLNIGAGEIAVILVVALLVLGPQRLPEMARAIGKFMREFRRQTDEVRTTLESEFYKMDQQLLLEEPPKKPAASKELPKPIPVNELNAEQSASPFPLISGPLDGGRRPADELKLPNPNANPNPDPNPSLTSSIGSGMPPVPPELDSATAATVAAEPVSDAIAESPVEAGAPTRDGTP